MDLNEPLARIKVIGVGFGGASIVYRMAARSPRTAQYLVCHPYWEAIPSLRERVEIHWPDAMENVMVMGMREYRVPGFDGSTPETLMAWAEESVRFIRHYVKGADLVIITANMGGPTGTGASPVIARVVRETGAALFAFVNTPFSFEGKRRSLIASSGIQHLKLYADKVIVVPADFILRDLKGLGFSGPKTSSMFSPVDEVVSRAIESVTDSINLPGLKKADLTDVARVMRIRGESTVAFGLGTDPECPALDAVKKAISNTAQPVDLAKARGALISFSAGPDTSVHDCTEALRFIADRMSSNAELAVAISNPDEALRGRVKLTLIVTGIDAPDGLHQ
jgi:cell division protein FtsZ